MTDEQSELSEEKKQEIVDSLNADTFDLDDFLNDRWEYPKFTATVYLDGERAARIAELDEQISEAESNRDQHHNNAKPSGSLAGGGKSRELESAEERVSALKTERASLAEQFHKSVLKVVFQQQNDSREVLRYATDKTKQAFPQLSDKDRENDEEANEYHGHWLMQQLIRDIYDHQGRKFQGEITFERVQKLASTVVGSERNKLRNNMFQALSGGNVIKQAVDAGFPG